MVKFTWHHNLLGTFLVNMFRLNRSYFDRSLELNMDIIEFTQLPKDEKTNYLWDYGVCLGQRLVREEEIVCLFQVNEFFVEAIYSRENNRVESILPLIEMAHWEAYVDLILVELIQ